jgi:hypothetical protein
MESLDLSTAPPRSPYAELGGVIFLPRTIDKVRAGLPGGNFGLYKIAGFSETMFEMLAIDEAAFTAAVAGAANDDDVLAFVTGATTPERIAEWNAWASERKPAGGDRERALVPFPWLADRDDIPRALDCIAEDDQRLFA